MKNFVTTLNKGNPSFNFLQSKFSAGNDAKLEAGVFNRPQMRELMRDSTFDKVLTKVEKKSMGIFQKRFH